MRHRLSNLAHRFGHWVDPAAQPLCAHDWVVTNYPAWQYFDIASYAGTKHCRRCNAMRYWTADEERGWL